VLERAFEPFFTTKGPAGGSGLGLASVYGIVERAGGRVHIVSAQGAGTTVTVELPGCDDVTASSEVFVGCDRPGAVVLVVDDEPDACVMTCRILHEAGFSTVAARDADTALEVLAQRRPDVLLTDVVLPGLDGPELAVRAREQFPDLPVVLMSGHRGAVVTRDLPLVTKPFDADTLVRAVAAALGADQARSCGGATMPVRTAMAVASSLE